MKAKTWVVATLLVHCVTGIVYCQQPTTDSAHVSREEHDRLRVEIEELKAQMREVCAQPIAFEE